MTEHLPKLAFLCVALAFSATAPVGAQTAREVAVNAQLAWCPEQSILLAARGLQEGIDLEPHQAAVLAACADVESSTVLAFGTSSLSVPVASRGDEGRQRGN